MIFKSLLDENEVNEHSEWGWAIYPSYCCFLFFIYTPAVVFCPDADMGDIWSLLDQILYCKMAIYETET
jgi:hypothetical protein